MTDYILKGRILAANKGNKNKLMKCFEVLLDNAFAHRTVIYILKDFRYTSIFCFQILKKRLKEKKYIQVLLFLDLMVYRFNFNCILLNFSHVIQNFVSHQIQNFG